MKKHRIMAPEPQPVPGGLLSLLWRAYFPGGFGKVHLVAIIYGAGVGGFVAGMVGSGAGPNHLSLLPIVGMVTVGAVVGAVFALSLVNNSRPKQ